MPVVSGRRGPVLMAAAVGALMAMGVGAFMISPTYIERIGWWWTFPLVGLVGAAVGIIGYQLTSHSS